MSPPPRGTYFLTGFRSDPPDSSPKCCCCCCCCDAAIAAHRGDGDGASEDGVRRKGDSGAIVDEDGGDEEALLLAAAAARRAGKNGGGWGRRWCGEDRSKEKTEGAEEVEEELGEILFAPLLPRLLPPPLLPLPPPPLLLLPLGLPLLVAGADVGATSGGGEGEPFIRERGDRGGGGRGRGSTGGGCSSIGFKGDDASGTDEEELGGGGEEGGGGRNIMLSAKGLSSEYCEKISCWLQDKERLIVRLPPSPPVLGCPTFVRRRPFSGRDISGTSLSSFPFLSSGTYPCRM